MVNFKGLKRGTISALLFVVSIIGCLLLGIPVGAQDITIEDEITYGKVGNHELKLDMARPAKGAGPFPALMFLYGGTWGEDPPGNRSGYSAGIRLAAYRGFVAVTVDVRYYVKEIGKTQYMFPGQLYDAKCAVRWLRANATKYNIDPKNIGVLGWSSGGWLALLLGLTQPSDGLEGECLNNMQFGSDVQAVVSLAGDTDLLIEHEYMIQNFAEGDIEDLLGGTPQEVPLRYQKASPISYVRKDAPPILYLQGERDHEDLLQWSELFDAKMNLVGATHQFVVLKGRFHENFFDEKNVWDFLKNYLVRGN